MTDLTREQQIRRLIFHGISPTEAERAADRADEFGFEDDLVELSAEMQEERARAWWWYQAEVKPTFRRLLDARVVDEEAIIA